MVAEEIKETERSKTRNESNPSALSFIIITNPTVKLNPTTLFITQPRATDTQHKHIHTYVSMLHYYVSA